MENQNQQVNQEPLSAPPPPVTPVTRTKNKLPIILGGILLLVLVSGGMYYLVSRENNMPLEPEKIKEEITSPPLTPREQDRIVEDNRIEEKTNIDRIITYTPPLNWTESGTTYRSPDYSLEDPNGPFSKGAVISITYDLIDPCTTTEDYIKNPFAEIDNEKLCNPLPATETKIVNRFTCSEGFLCEDAYYLRNNSNLIIVNFQCAENCNSKVNTDNHHHSVTRDKFVNSINFK